MNKVCAECTHVRCELLRPFIKALPHVIAKPLSKRMPKGLRCNRRGFTSIEVFCMDFQALMANFPIVADYDFSEAFQLRDKL